MAKAFERIVIVMLENATRGTVLQNRYMNLLRQKGVFLKNSFGVTHPSQPNYIALIGGDTLGICCDDPGWVKWIYTDNPPPVTSIVDLLERRGLTWKAYAEELLPSDIVTPGNLPPPAGHGNFARKHVPFLSFPNIVCNTERAKCIVPAPQFQNDFGHDLPQYSFYTPNLINDGHSLPSGEKADPTDGRNIDNIATFLRSFLSDDPIGKFPPETLIVITFDEAYPYFKDYNIYTLLIGDMLPAGTTRTEPYNHYSLLRSVEFNFSTGTLGRNDEQATPYWFLTGG